MSRHRNVRTMNYDDEYDGYDDVYGHSVEDDYCISPATAAQFLYNRDAISSLSSYMKEQEIPEEEEEELSDHDEGRDPMTDSAHFQKPILSDNDQARLNSCLEEMRNVIGDSTPEHILIDAVMKHQFNYELALDAVLSHQEPPKPQREPRQRKARSGASSTNSTNQSNSSSSSQPQLSSGANAHVSNDVSHLNNDVNRMTFSFSKDTASSRSNHNTHNHKVEERSTSRASDAKASASAQNVSSDHMLVPTTATEGATAATSSESVTATPKKESQGSAAKRRQNALEEYKKRKSEGKDLINLVVIGHVDAGKSTLMGHLLFQLGSVNKRTMHKYEQESKKLGKASFAYAWVLDETEEERSRGVTMDVAQTRFETDNKSIILLDAPGHKDFIPNMITGAAQADVAILVVNATRGEFETGFETGGQTREHAMLIRSLGVSQLVVAVNKMDTVDWSKERYAEVLKKLGHFLKQTGFKEADVNYVPCSGLSGENLAQPATDTALTSWYSGPTLLQLIDKFKSPERDVDKVLRFCVSDVFKGLGAGFSVSGTLQAGFLQASNKVLVMPHGETANVKGVTMDDLPVSYAFAGDTVTLTLTNMDIANVSVGSVICDINSPIRSTTRFLARVVIFTIDLPITKGFPVVLHYQSLSEPAQIRKLISQLHKGTGEVIKKKPRCLVKNTSAIVEIEVNRPVCVELYKDFKDLGRFMLRYGGTTIAAGLVTQILDDKPSRD